MKRLWVILLFITSAFGQEREEIIEKWVNGVVKTKHYFKGEGFDEELIGKKTYYKNGDIRWKCKYKNSKRHGEYSFYLEGNELLLKGNYKNGDDYDGEWYAYYPQEMYSKNGNDYFEGEIKDVLRANSLNGSDFFVEVFFHPNGELSDYTVSYMSNVESDMGKFPSYGKNYTWHENGMIKRIVEYPIRRSSVNYKQKGWYDSGELRFEQEFSDDMESSKNIFYHKNGNKDWETETIKGKEIYFHTYDQNGNLKYRRKY